MSVRVRFAPSPTGQIHVGNARAALFNWLFARHEGGVFVLRIEDTDVERHQPGAEEAIFADLRWLGLTWDEGPQVGGPYGPYAQSERGAFYDSAIESLRMKGSVYPCFCSDALLEDDRRGAIAAGRTPGYLGRCAEIEAGQAWSRVAGGEPAAVRFRVGRFGVVHDLLRGDVDFRTRQAFDTVVRRRDGRPTYNFAVVVDDAAMKITHVLRGEDHLTNTALQMRLYDDFGYAAPAFAHLPLILGDDGTPLSKRHGASSVGDMRERGYAPLGLVNALAHLGWTPPQTDLPVSLEALASTFEIAHVHVAAAIFDVKKLDWLSAQVIRTMDRDDRARAIGERLGRAGSITAAPDVVFPWLQRLGDLLATSLERFETAPERCAFIFAFDPQRAVAAGAFEGEGARGALETFASLFDRGGALEEVAMPGLIDRAKKETGLKGRALMHPLRAAVTGQESGPELNRSIPLIDEAARLRIAPGLLGPAERIRRVLALASGGPPAPEHRA